MDTYIYTYIYIYIYTRSSRGTRVGRAAPQLGPRFGRGSCRSPKSYPHRRLQSLPRWKNNCEKRRNTKISLAAGIGGWGYVSGSCLMGLACWRLQILLLVIRPAILPSPNNMKCDREPKNHEHNPRPTPKLSWTKRYRMVLGCVDLASSDRWDEKTFGWSLLWESLSLSLWEIPCGPRSSTPRNQESDRVEALRCQMLSAVCGLDAVSEHFATRSCSCLFKSLM